jgi:hypothetical protein
MKMTPGLWKVMNQRVVDESGLWIADCDAAHAPLIAAAPKMLAALRAVAKWEADGASGLDVFGMVHDAIAKTETCLQRDIAAAPDMLAAARHALSTLEAIELLDAARFGLKPEAITASCNALHAAIAKAEETCLLQGLAAAEVTPSPQRDIDVRLLGADQPRYSEE